MPYDNDIDVEDEDGLTAEDRLVGLPSGFGHYHSRFHPTTSNAFQAAAERKDVDVRSKTDAPSERAEIDAFLDSILSSKH